MTRSFSNSEVYQLHYLVEKIDRIANDSILDASGLTMKDFYLLTMVYDHPGCSHRYVCERLGLSPASISLRVKDLVRKGFLLQSVNPDNRKECFLHLTVVGGNTFAALGTQLTSAFEELLDSLGSRKQDFRDLLSILVARLDQKSTLDPGKNNKSV